MRALELRLPLDLIFSLDSTAWIDAIFSSTICFSILSFSSSCATAASISLMAAFLSPKPLTNPSEELRWSKLPFSVILPSSFKTMI